MFSFSVSELKKVFEEAVRQDLGMNRYFNMNTKEVLPVFKRVKPPFLLLTLFLAGKRGLLDVWKGLKTTLLLHWCQVV